MLRIFTNRTAALIVALLLAHCSFAQIIFRDEFDRAQLGTAWKTSSFAGSGWVLSDGQARNYTDSPIGGTLRTTTAFPQTAFVLETRGFPFVRDYKREYAITFGSPDADQDYGYVITYNTSLGRGFTLDRLDGSIYYPTELSSSSVVLDPTLHYNFRIERYPSGEIKVFIDSGNGYSPEPVLQAVDKTYPALGSFGWLVRTESNPHYFFVDWIEARILGEPETGLLTRVQVSTGKTYPVGQIAPGNRLYIDRDYVFVKAPDYLNGAAYIRTANADKKQRYAALSFDLAEAAVLFVLYDPRATSIPAWLSGFTKLPDQVITTDTGTQVLNVYTKAYFPGRVTLGANLADPAAGALTNYLVAAIPVPKEAVFEAEKASLKGAVVASNHSGYSGTGFVDYLNPEGDSITWQVYTPLAGQYKLSFRYALKNGDRPLVLGVNDNQVGSVAFTATGSWSTWWLSPVVSTPLKAGFNTVTLFAYGVSGANLDYLLVLPELVDLPTGRLGAGQPAVSLETAPLSSFPNPTTGRTTIRYRLEEAAPVTLSLFDARGQKVATLIEHAQRAAGAHEHVFDARQVQSGLYFCRLRAGATERVIKVIVNR